MKFLLSLSLAVLMVSCVGTTPPKSDTEALVGLWRQDLDWQHTVILRRADGTYAGRVCQAATPGHPPLCYRSSGRWSVHGGQYVTTIDKISVEIWQRKQAGRTFERPITELDGAVFRYVSTDGHNEEELRIGAATDKAFEDFRLKEFLPDGVNSVATPRPR